VTGQDRWHPRIPERLDDEELADWRPGRNAVYRFAAVIIGGRRRIRGGFCGSVFGLFSPYPRRDPSVIVRGTARRALRF
jgi:hypothetical protein